MNFDICAVILAVEQARIPNPLQRHEVDYLNTHFTDDVIVMRALSRIKALEGHVSAGLKALDDEGQLSAIAKCRAFLNDAMGGK